MRIALESGARAIACAALLFASCIAGGGTPEGAPEARILGNWFTEGHEGIIRIIQRPDGRFDGRIVGGDDIDRPDLHNPDPRKRDQVLRGGVILEGLRYDGRDRWSGGTVYDPDSGRTYRCHIDLTAPGTLRLRGFIGFSMLGRSQTWTRYEGVVTEPPTGR